MKKSATKKDAQLEKIIGMEFVERNSPFFQTIRLGICVALLILQVIIFINNFGGKIGGFPRWIIILAIEIMFSVSILLNTFVCKKFQHRIACYVVDFIAQFALTFLTNGTYLCYIYLLILTEFYISNNRMTGNFVMVVASLIIYLVTYGCSSSFLAGKGVVEVVTSCFAELTVIVFHFLVVNFALNAYDARKKITQSLAELDESNRKLQKAYDELKEVTILQERQRIAREIHDTAGHSITTVIMQTEAAKLIVEENPQEAKQKIVAANLQAKNALEELRSCVHLLAGEDAEQDLKTELERIVRDSCDGTDIAVRSSIEPIVCSREKQRFLCNALKEGIANGLRHGHATAFYFELRVEGAEIFFLLSDNGTGVNMEQLQTGFGMKSMQSRAESFGGRVRYDSHIDEGFEIEIRLPTDKEEKTV